MNLWTLTRRVCRWEREAVAFRSGPQRLVIFSMLVLAGSMDVLAQAPATKLAISRSNQNVAVGWVGDTGVAYQLEASADLTTWGDLGALVIGNGSFVNFPFPLAGQSRIFFRLTFPGVQSAIFDPSTGVLTITGDPLDDSIVVGRDGAGNLQINNGDVPITGGSPTITNTTVIRIHGGAGADRISLDESHGALPAAELYGEGGDDILTGGSGSDVLLGGPGNDTLFGQAGADTLLGGDDNDTLTGGAGDDQVFGEAGNDRLIWNPGDGTDMNEGGTETDTVEVNGSNAAEVFTTTANGTRVRFDGVSPVAFFLDIGTCENLLVKANAGNDQFSATGNLAALISITVDGGPGDDILLGSNGPDIFIGGDDNDLVDGNQGNDVAFLGNGNDTFRWDPGDGSDTIEGQAGNDTLFFNCSNANEMVAVSANGARVRVTRDIAAIAMDLDDVERFEVNTLGGTDTLTINDLSGTDLVSVLAHLAATGGAADGSADTVNINGTAVADSITTSLSAIGLTVTGLRPSLVVDGFDAGTDIVRIDGQGGDDIFHASAASSGGPIVSLDGGIGTDTVEVNGLEVAEGFTATANGSRVRFDRLNPAPFFLDIGTTESLVVNANGGNDTFSATGNLAALIQITVDGGAGEDTLLGSNGVDTLIGGADNDFIDGNQGNDTILLGLGDDTFQWDPGDGSDVVEGQGGHDTVVFNGSATGETFTFSANGTRLLFTRNIGAITLDAHDISQFNLRALGGADIVTLNDLAGTGITQVNLELAGAIGGSTGDGAVDAVTMNGTTGPDAFSFAANAGAIEVDGLATQLRILRSDAASDSLTVNGLGGVDTFNVGAGVTGLIQLTTNQ